MPFVTAISRPLPRLAAALCCAFALLGAAEDRLRGSAERRVRLFNTHTQERIDVVYQRDGEYVPEALADLERFLRDHRTGDQHPFDPQVFDILADLSEAVGRPAAEYHVISGYRCPKTNEALRAKGGGQAQRSLHMEARAMDVRLPGTSTATLRDAALRLQRGGVGFYAASDFVHVDTGRVRRW